MNSVTKHADALTKSSRDISQAYFDLSQSFHWLSTTEGDTLGSALSWVSYIKKMMMIIRSRRSMIMMIIIEVVVVVVSRSSDGYDDDDLYDVSRSSDDDDMFYMIIIMKHLHTYTTYTYIQVANTTSTLSTTTQRHAEAETIKLAEPLEEYTRMMSSIKTAINQRQIKKQDYITCLIDLECKQNSYRKSKDIPGKEIQANNKEILVNAAQIATESSKLEFEKISEKLLNEFEIFKNQKAVDFKEIILNFVNLQV
jgi:hypothetical protein